MHIWVDGQCLQTGSRDRGIGRYVVDLLQAMACQPGIQLTVSLNAALAEEAISARNWLAALVPQAGVAIWRSTADQGEGGSWYSLDRRLDEQMLAVHINAIGPDIALSPSPFEGVSDSASPFLDSCPVEALTACIFHDAIQHRYPGRYLHSHNEAAAYYRRLVAVGHFDLVLANSDFTASEYRAIFGQTNCVSIYAGLSANFQALLRDRTIVPSQSLMGKLARTQPAATTASPGQTLAAATACAPAPFALYVGGMDWRKNVPFLVPAFAALAEPYRSGLRLVVAGVSNAAEAAGLHDAWRKCGLPKGNLIIAGWISDAELVWLYRHAAMTLQPSFMEGFGLGALEAMAAGCVFLAARGSAVGEVVGSEAQLFDPTDPADLAQLMAHLLNDPHFCTQTVQHGFGRTRSFSWDRSAHIAIAALKDALAKRRVLSAPQPALPDQAHRLIMDVTSTVQSPGVTGIQRVIHKLSSALRAQDEMGVDETVFSYCRNTSGWFHLPRLAPEAVSLVPQNRLNFGTNDTYFLLDSSWAFHTAQRDRLIEALIEGQEVINGVHDLGPLTRPALTSPGMPFVFRAWFEFILGHSTAIICVSRAVADEIIRLVEAIQTPRPLKIGYLRLGCDFSDVPAEPQWLDFLGDRPVFLMVGTIEPRKGHSIALAAMEKLWAKGSDSVLLIIGKPGWDTLLLQQRLAAHPEAERRLFVRDGISDGQLRAAYGHATALLMTSYLEGFGLPVVEARHFGCPVVLSDIPVFREVGEGAPAARYFRAEDSDDLARVLGEILVDGITKGEAVQWPTWAESAADLRAMIREDRWYYRYQPKVSQPNVYARHIGNVRMEHALSPAERAHRLRFVDGPQVADDGGEIRLMVALRNDSGIIWSSQGRTEGGLEINLSIRYYNAVGTCVDTSGRSSPIPFVLLPGEEIFLSVRVPVERIAEGVVEVGCEVTQEKVGWFGGELRLSLLGSPAATLPMHGLNGDFSGLKPALLRRPFRHSPGKMHALLALLNPTDQAIAGGPAVFAQSLKAVLVNEAGGALGEAKVSVGFHAVGPLSFGLAMLEAPAMLMPASNLIDISLDGPTPARWRLNCGSARTERLQADEAGVST